MPTVKPIPDGYHSVSPYLIIDSGRASEALDFYARAFGAKEKFRMPNPEGGIMHAEMQLGDSVIMIADESPKMEAYGPKQLRRLAHHAFCLCARCGRNNKTGPTFRSENHSARR